MTTAQKRVVGVLSAIYFEPGVNPVDGSQIARVRTAVRGDEVALTSEEEQRLQDAGALLPAGSKPEDAQAVADARVDAYRAQRGDSEALQRHIARVSGAAGSADVVNVEADVDNSSVADLAEWIKDAKPNVDDTVALAEGDPERARKVLDAESSATGGSPRQGVSDKLEKIIAG